MRQEVQALLDQYNSGLAVVSVNFQKAYPPDEVADAFRDVSSAREDKARVINEAEGYRNSIIPEARGQAGRTLIEARSYAQVQTDQATGAAQAFDSILTQYRTNSKIYGKEVTRFRLYLETMEQVLPRVQTYVVQPDERVSLRLLNGTQITPSVPQPLSPPAAPPSSLPGVPARLDDRLRTWGPSALALGLALVGVIFIFRDNLIGPTPPAPDVVATFDGGQITVEDVRQHLAELVPNEIQRTQLQNIQGYRLIVQEMLTEELVRRWAAEREAGQDEDIQHVMQHITEEINLDELHTQMHQGQMGVTAGDIQAYYQANRDQFGDLTVTQVREQIRATLQSQQEDQFVQNYIDELKEKATITRNFDLLAVPEPTEQELEAYYQANLAQFLIPARAVLNEILIPVGQDEAAAQEQAGEALVRLRSGEAFAAVAIEVSQTPMVEGGLTVFKGQRDPAYDEVVFNLDQGQISEVFRAGDAFYIVWLESKEPERRQSLDEMRAQVHQTVLAAKEAAWFAENANQTLLTIDGKRFTVGEFWREYRELPASFIFEYQGPEGRQALVERLIERLLLVEDSYDQLLEADNQVELEEIRLDVLAQMMQQEEVDDKIEITDEELRAHYEQDKAQLVEPPQARIRQIVIRVGQTEDEYQRAWEKADEAYQKLVPGLFQSGADFAAVAREYSEDEATANQGGEVPGWLGESPDLFTELVEHPFHEQVLRLAEGEISRPFEWNGAIYIVQVIERTEPRPLSFEEAQDLLREELRLQKHEELEVQLSEKLLEQAQITIYDDVLQTLVEGQNRMGQLD